MLDDHIIETHNTSLSDAHDAALHRFNEHLEQQGWDTEALIERVAAFEVAVPSWALGTGGTRFGRFPTPGEPRDVYEKTDDIGVVQQLTRAAPRVSLHIPWDEPDDVARLRDHAHSLDLGFDAVNSNTFQDQDGQAHSYKFGSLGHVQAAVRQQAIDHNRHVIALGEQLGSKALTVWLADGANYPGQMHLRRSFERVRDSLAAIYDALPEDWRLLVEYKPYEPAFYATVIQDWGSSLMLAQALGERAQCLVDLGHHLPNTNIELIVARLITAGKLGGFHFNDSKYGDDDLTAGSIKPYQLFLVMNELVDAEEDGALEGFTPAYMIDQSHNVKHPIEALLQTVQHIQQAYTKALLVDRKALATYQDEGDVLMAERTVRDAFETDVRSLTAEVRRRQGGALDPVTAFRASGYREKIQEARAGEAYAPPQSL